MPVLLQEVGVAGTPLKVMVLVPCVAPKFRPLAVTDVPATPEVGDSEVMLTPTVNVTELLAYPLTVTMTGPVVNPEGTGATTEALVQLTGVLAMPFKETVLLP
jgi:hypothetical protein